MDASITRLAPTQHVATARAAFDSGRTRAYAWRVAQLEALARMLKERGPELERALAADLGRPPVEALLMEIIAVHGEVTHTLKHLRHWMRDRKVRVPASLQPAAGYVHREPLGVALIIAPWNYPVLLLSPLVGALAAGNAVVLKPSEVSAATAAVLARVIPEYLDPEAVRVVDGGVEETTVLLTCRFDHIFYTGNGAVGRIVMAAAARHLTPVTLELGGKSPVWIDETADLSTAAGWLAWGKFLNAGQTCIAPDYIVATPSVQAQLVPLLEREIEKLFGADVQASADYGRIINPRHTDRLIGLLDSGALALGGEFDREQQYIAPTVLTDVTLDDPAMQDEIFGPILPIVTVGGLDEAIEIINQREKPLTLYVFTGDPSVRRRIVDETSSGSIAIDSTIVQIAIPSLPFGGVGASGMGSYHSEASMRLFSHEKPVFRKRRGPNLVAMARAPYASRKERMFRKSLA